MRVSISKVNDVDVRGGGVVEGQVGAGGGRKARLQVSRWLVQVQVWSAQLVVAPLRTYYIA